MLESKAEEKGQINQSEEKRTKDSSQQWREKRPGCVEMHVERPQKGGQPEFNLVPLASKNVNFRDHFVLINTLKSALKKVERKRSHSYAIFPHQSLRTMTKTD